MAYAGESEPMYYEGHEAPLRYDSDGRGQEHGNEEQHQEDHAIGIAQSSRSILDQVDDFLNDHQNEREHTAEGEIKDGLPSSHSQSTTWMPSGMQVDLDHLSETLFTHPHANEHNDDHDMELSMGLDLDKEKNGSHHSHSLAHGPAVRPHHIRPDLVASPMVSPMITATETHLQIDTPFLGHSNGHIPSGYGQDGGHGLAHGSDHLYSLPNGGNQWKPKTLASQSQFSPLSSPALTAIDNAQRINFALPESTLSSASMRKKTTRSNKRRTPSNSTNSSSSSSTTKVAKNSPRLSANPSSSSKRHSKASPITSNANGNSWDDLIFRLPESSIEVDHHNIANNVTTDGETPQSSSGRMSSSPESRMTPATLMNYPKVILPSNTISASRIDHSMSPHDFTKNNIGEYSTNANSNDSNKSYTNDRNSNNSSNNDGDNNNNNNNNNNSNNNNEENHNHTHKHHSNPNSSNANSNNSSLNGAHVIRATESPVIKPKPSIPLSRNGSKVKVIDEQPTPSTSTIAQTMVAPEKQRRTSRSKRKASVSSSINGGGGSSDDGDQLKKEVHKAAEQGRRNRLNVALNDLDSLLPLNLKESITIPSKATTVELACSFIRQLLEAEKNSSTS
ncbi:hypothetical protein HG535_0F03220 [Zygotorulaspora mrakii]|uniref:BHLH domain-containing protein n=1 Tax=Zygotorulaspora mrakii TaxID=42260 RepID=A0A7H9B545_ZYGMR|nr:uncharacterized protein HG535_0F03220 [Zygotorulaspora mrakii]QLG73811.1 hypothetical protein HG535_0F03220 [Zygotorulaspora mrakii]